MFVELHMLQNFAPSCLNRDDTNSPKDCEFGGYRRARISSQCLKRAIRTHFKDAALLPEKNLAERTKRVVELIAGRLAKDGKDLETAKKAVIAALGAARLKAEPDGAEVKTQYLLFLGNQEIDKLTKLVATHWEALTKQPEAAESTGKKKTAKQQKADAQNAVPPEVVKAVDKLLDGGKAADLALFGRMLADTPEFNVEAAAQVAHAITIHPAEPEEDYFTAVDDLNRRDESGSSHIGESGFGAGVFYIYICISRDLLLENLGGDKALAARAIRALVSTACTVAPTGKQNSFASRSRAYFAQAELGDAQPRQLTVAFLKTARGSDGDLARDAIKALQGLQEGMDKVYGKGEDRRTMNALEGEGTLEELLAFAISEL